MNSFFIYLIDLHIKLCILIHTHTKSSFKFIESLNSPIYLLKMLQYWGFSCTNLENFRLNVVFYLYITISSILISFIENFDICTKTEHYVKPFFVKEIRSMVINNIVS